MTIIKITVKTLEAQNYGFNATEDMTVAQFKQQIQDTVNVPAADQRLIFCGRVLQDNQQLLEIDCNEKVMHLVRRPPPPLDNQESDSSAGQSRNDSNANNNSARENVNNPVQEIFLSAISIRPESFDVNIVNNIIQTIMANISGSRHPAAPRVEQAVNSDIDIDDGTPTHHPTPKTSSASTEAEPSDQTTSSSAQNQSEANPDLRQIIRTNPSWLQFIEKDIEKMKRVAPKVERSGEVGGSNKRSNVATFQQER